MSTTVTTAPDRPAATLVPAAVLAVLLVAILMASGARLTWQSPIVVTEVRRSAAVPSVATAERAQRLAVARHDLAAVRTVVRHSPSLRVGLHDEVQLLAAVGAGHVPVEALDRAGHDRARLHAAVNRGHVPHAALQPRG